jgi:hypothetical protein
METANLCMVVGISYQRVSNAQKVLLFGAEAWELNFGSLMQDCDRTRMTYSISCSLLLLRFCITLSSGDPDWQLFLPSVSGLHAFLDQSMCCDCSFDIEDRILFAC